MDSKQRHRGVRVFFWSSSSEQVDGWRQAARRARRNLSDWIRVTLDDASGIEVPRKKKSK